MGEFLGNNQTIVADQGPASGLDTLLTGGGERDVGDTGVLAAERPLRLPVTDDEHAGRRHSWCYALLWIGVRLVVWQDVLGDEAGKDAAEISTPCSSVRRAES